MPNVKYIAVPCDEELLKAVDASCGKSGLKRGPEVALRLRKVYKIGPFAKKVLLSYGLV